MSKETLSVRQANNIIDEANRIYGRCNGDMNDSFGQFLEDLSKVWEDNNAVELAGKVNDSYQNILENLTKNNAVFCESIKNIAEMYIHTGGMREKVSATAHGFGGVLDLGVVKPYFSNTENADDFGFLDIETSPAKVMESLDTLKKKINDISTQIVDSIKGIPAFGNTNVKLEIAKSAGRVVDITKEGLDKVRTSTKDALAESAKAYGTAGELSVAVATLGDNMEDIEKFKDKFPTPPIAKYAPPPAVPPIPIAPISIPPEPIPPQTKYAPPPAQPPIPIDPPVHVEIPPQTKYAPPPVQPQIHVEVPQTKYAPPSMRPGKNGKGK